MENQFLPNIDALQNIICLLQNSQQPNNETQQNVYNKFEEYSKTNEFYYYLALILQVNTNEIQLNIREVAGATLKTMVDRNFEQIPHHVLDYIKQKLFDAFTDHNETIRKLVGNLMTGIIAKGGLSKWPNFLPFIIVNLDSQDLISLESSIDCVAKLVEDLRVNRENYSFLDQSKGGEQIDQLIPKLLNFQQQKYVPTIQIKSLSCLNLCINAMPPSLRQNIQLFLKILIDNCSSSNHQLRLKGFQGLCLINETQSDYLKPYIKDILLLVVQGCQDQENSIARQSCSFIYEFISAAQDYEEIKQNTLILEPLLPQLLPALLLGLKYTTEDLMNLLPGGSNRYKKSKQSVDNNSEEDLDNEDDQENGQQNTKEKYDLFENEQWTLRTWCATIFKKLTVNFREKTFNILQGQIQILFQDKVDWKNRESAILCLGAIADGGLDALQATIQQFIVNLLNEIQNVKENEYLIVSTTIWTVSKYTNWISQNISDNKQVLELYLGVLLRYITDKQLKIQEATCDALGLLIDNASFLLVPYLKDVLQIFQNAIKVYKSETLINLLQTIQVLYEQMEKDLQNEISFIIVDPLVDQFLKLKNNNTVLLNPLLDTLVVISQSMEQYFSKYCPDCFKKCLEIMEEYILMLQDQDFQCKQFIVSLMSEISKYAPLLIKNNVLIYVKYLASNIQLFPSELDPGDSYIYLANNCVWCLTEFCIAYQEELKQHIYEISCKIISLLVEREKIEKVIARNFAKAIGKLSSIDPQNISKELNRFIKQWCLIMRSAPYDEHKISSFQGIFMLIFKNPSGIMDHMTYFIDCFVNFNESTQEQKSMFLTIIKDFKNTMNEQQWENYFKNPCFAPGFRNKLRNLYQI